MGDNEIGKRLRKIRREKDLTQLDFAAQLGISVSTIRVIERGGVEPSCKTLVAYAKAGADINLVLTGIKKEKSC